MVAIRTALHSNRSNLQQIQVTGWLPSVAQRDVFDPSSTLPHATDSTTLAAREGTSLPRPTADDDVSAHSEVCAADYVWFDTLAPSGPAYSIFAST